MHYTNHYRFNRYRVLINIFCFLPFFFPLCNIWSFSSWLTVQGETTATILHMKNLTRHKEIRLYLNFQRTEITLYYRYKTQRCTKRCTENIINSLVIWNTAVNHCLLAGVYNDKWQMDDRIGRWRSICLLFCLTISLNKVLEGNLLEKSNSDRKVSLKPLKCC